MAFKGLNVIGYVMMLYIIFPAAVLRTLKIRQLASLIIGRKVSFFENSMALMGAPVGELCAVVRCKKIRPMAL